MSDLHERLIKLADRGTPRGVDDVFEAAVRKASFDAVDGSSDDDLDAIPFVTEEPTRWRAPRRRFSSMIAAAGMAVLLVVGMLAISAVVGNGGASSPEDAVRRLADAVSHEDPLAAADLLSPSEVRSLHGTLDAAARKAQELKLVDTASAPLSGVDFSVDDLHLSTNDLADGYAKVTVDGGSFSASTAKPKFSALMQRVLRNSDDNSAQADLASLTDSLDHMPVFVVAVREDGHWYVSAAYTVMEYVTEYNHLPAAEFGSGQRDAATLGADTPDAAVQDALRATADGNWTKLISLAPPDEIPVHDFRAALAQLIAQNRDPSTSTFTVDSAQTSSQVGGDTAQVTLTASGTLADGTGTWQWKDGCYTSKDEGGDAPNVCVPGGLPRAWIFAEQPDPEASTTIKVVREHGRWFVSPVGTVLDVVDRIIKNVTRRDLYTLLQIPQELPAEGVVTLGQPITIAANDRGAHVFTFEGHKGERLLGLASTTEKKLYGGVPVAFGMFDPGGQALDQIPLYGSAAELPVDGTYKVVIESYGTVDVTVTLWDEADAPAAAKQQPNESCSYDLNGGQRCFSQASPVPIGGGLSSSSSESFSTVPPSTGVSTIGSNG